jgi:predicted RNA-binding protein with PUA-like domain
MNSDRLLHVININTYGRPCSLGLKNGNFFFDSASFYRPATPFWLAIFTLILGSNLCDMAYWLVKSEPAVYSWERLQKDKLTRWDGIRNYAARLHLRAMKMGDQVLFYHSNEGLAIVGIAQVAKECYPDPTGDPAVWVAVDLKPYRSLPRPVSLDSIKRDKRLADMALVRIGRLSVQPVKDSEWAVIMELAGE